MATSCAVLIPAESATAADPSVRLPLGTVSDILVDQAAGLVFVSGGHDSTTNGVTGGVVTAGLQGTGVHMVLASAQMGGLALGPDGRVYAADLAGQIVSIDPANAMAVTSVPAADCPDSLAAVGERIWFSYGCDTQTGSGLGFLDLSTGTVTEGVLAGSRLVRSAIAAVPDHPDEMVVSYAAAGDPASAGTAPTHADLSVVSIADTAGTVNATVTNAAAVDNVDDIAVMPDGGSVVIANEISAPRYTLPDLTPEATTYQTPSGEATAVAASTDGAYVAASVGSPGEPDEITTFAAETGDSIRTFDTATPGSANPGQTNLPAAHGLAWTGHSLLAVYVDYLREVPTLKVLNSALQATTALTATGPSVTKGRNSQLTISGLLTSRGAAVVGGQLTVTHTDLSGTHPLPAVTTTSTGHYSFRDHPSVGSTNTYTVHYAGDATHAPISRTVHVSVSRSTPSLSLTTNKSHYNYGGIVTVHAHLGSTFNGRTVTLYGQGLGFKKVLLRTGRVDRHGNISARAQVGVRATLWVSFPGDYHYAPRTVKVVRTVAAQLVAVLGKTKHHTGKYSVYPQKKGAVFAAGVAPNKSGECLRFVLQHHTRTGWHTGANQCFALDRTSVTGVVVGGATHTQYRIRAEYHGDRANTKKTGNWHYFEFS